MKKSKKIHLVLITAALASCNRVIIPSQPDAGYIADSTLTHTPAGDDSTYDCCRELNMPLYNYPFNLSGIYYSGGPVGGLYYPVRTYRKGAFWRSHRFIVRGGFGKAAASVAGS